MSLVVVDISISLDGFVAASGTDLGDERIHEWVFNGDEADVKVMDAMIARSGAVIMGRTTFDIIDGPDGWNDELGYGGLRNQAHMPPNFVVTSHAPTSIRLADRFTVVTDGLESAIDQAHAVAAGKDIMIMGGGTLARTALEAGLVDELVLHVAPIISGGGTSMMPAVHVDLEPLGTVITPAAQHLSYRVGR